MISKNTAMKRVFKTAPFAFSSGYTWRIHPITHLRTFHYGWDFSTAQHHTPMYSFVWGEVKRATYNRARGWLVEIKTLNGYILMQHLEADTIKVKVGQKVMPGTFIANSGESGASKGIHLHLECYNKTHVVESPATFMLTYKDLTFKRMTVNTKELNVRIKPDEIDGKIKYQLAKGEHVTVYKTVEDGEGREWAKISYTQELYVAKWLLV